MTADDARPRLLEIADLLRQEPDTHAVAGDLLDVATALLHPGRFHVVMSGEFKVGKSTLLNAMVSLPGVFPNHPNASTAVSTTLAWGEQPGARVVRTSGSGPDAVTVLIDAVEQAIVDPESASVGVSQVVHVDMWAPVDRLASGVVLVDTPGLGGTNRAHDLNTAQFLERADLVVFVTAVGKPLSTTQLAALETAADGTRPLICAVTKEDLEEPTPYVDAARARIAERLGCPPDELVVLSLSARRALRADRTGSVSDRALSQVDKLWAEIERRHLAWREERSTTAVLVLQRAIANAAAPLQVDAGAVDALLRQFEDLRRLRADSPAAVEREMTTAVERLRSESRQRFAELRKAVATQTKLFSSYLDPDSYVENFNQAVVAIRAASDQALIRLAADFVEQWSRRTEITIELSPANGPHSLLDPLELKQFRGQPRWLTVSAIREAAAAGRIVRGIGGGLGSGVGALVGTLVGGVFTGGVGLGVGLLIGQLAGWAAGLRDVRAAAIDTFNRTRVHELAKVAPGWADHHAEVEDAWLLRCGAELTADLQRQLTAGWAELEAVVHQALSARGTDEATANANAARLAVLAKLQAELDAIGGTPDGDGA